MVQWLRLHTSNVGREGLIPDQGTRSHTLQLRNHTPPSKDPASRSANPSGGRSKDPEQPNKLEIKRAGNVYSDSLHVFNWVVELWKFFTYPGYNLLIGYRICKTLSHFVDFCLFTFWGAVLPTGRVLVLWPGREPPPHRDRKSVV